MILSPLPPTTQSCTIPPGAPSRTAQAPTGPGRSPSPPQFADCTHSTVNTPDAAGVFGAVFTLDPAGELSIAHFSPDPAHIHLSTPFHNGRLCSCDCTIVLVLYVLLCSSRYCVLVHCTCCDVLLLCTTPCGVSPSIFVNLMLPVRSLVEQWLHLSVSGQDKRVSHCSMSMLEDSIRKLCDLTNRDFCRYVLRSKSVLASNIGDIFRCTLRGLLGKLRPRACTIVCLLYPSDLDGAMKTAFDVEIFCSLTDVSEERLTARFFGIQLQRSMTALPGVGDRRSPPLPMLVLIGCIS